MKERYKPVYQSKRVTVYLADAGKVLPTFSTESFDLILTDPPYGMQFSSKRRVDSFGEIANDAPHHRDGIRAVLTECVRLVGQHRHLYVFGPEDALSGLKVSGTTSLIWDKGRMGMGNLSAPWGPSHEPLTFAVSAYRHAGKKGQMNLAVRMRKGSVLRFSAPTGRNVRHPNEKPIELLRELIESSSRGGDVVLDPYAGSGSVGVAAIYSGRRATLIECEPRWVQLIVQRIKAAEELVDRMNQEGETNGP